MLRHSKQYKRNKLAWELLQSPQWQELLKPELEICLNRPSPQIACLDDTYKAAKDQAVKQHVLSLINRIERYAREFVGTQVEGELAPVVVPD